MRLGPMLWTRRPEHWNFLALRLGVGRARSRNSVRESESSQPGIARYVRQVEVLRERYRDVDDVPVMETLPSAGALGIAGPMHLAADAVRGLGVQLFGLHAPNEVVTAAIVDPAWRRELEWLKWLPHTSSSRNPFAESALADSQAAGSALLSVLEEAILERLGEAPVRRGPLPEAEASMRLGAEVGHRDRRPRGAAPSRHGPRALRLGRRAGRPSAPRAAHRARTGGRHPHGVRRPDGGVAPGGVPHLPRRHGRTRPGDRRRRALRRGAHADRGRGRLEPLRRGLRQAPGAGRRREHGRRGLERPPAQRLDARPPRRRGRLAAVERGRAVAAEQLDRRSHRGAADAAAQARRHAEGVRRPVGSRRDDARPAHAGPARARRRHDRIGQVASSCRRGCSAWPPSTAPTGSRSSSSTTRAAPRSRTASTCRTASASSPT